MVAWKWLKSMLWAVARVTPGIWSCSTRNCPQATRVLSFPTFHSHGRCTDPGCDAGCMGLPVWYELRCGCRCVRKRLGDHVRARRSAGQRGPPITGLEFRDAEKYCAKQSEGIEKKTPCSDLFFFLATLCNATLPETAMYTGARLSGLASRGCARWSLGRDRIRCSGHVCLCWQRTRTSPFRMTATRTATHP